MNNTVDTMNVMCIANHMTSGSGGGGAGLRSTSSARTRALHCANLRRLVLFWEPIVLITREKL